ncbi:hypothetical protein L9F63_013732, partial [Diploptera punctata]
PGQVSSKIGPNEHAIHSARTRSDDIAKTFTARCYKVIVLKQSWIGMYPKVRSSIAIRFYLICLTRAFAGYFLFNGVVGYVHQIRNPFFKRVSFTNRDLVSRIHTVTFPTTISNWNRSSPYSSKQAEQIVGILTTLMSNVKKQVTT